MRNKKAFHEALPAVTKFFNLGDICGVTKAGGTANENYFVRTAKGQFVVKIMLEQQTLSNKMKEVIYVSHLIKHGIPATPYLTGRGGSLAYLYVDGQTVAMVQKLISGYHPAYTLAAVSEVGRYLGKLSLVPYAGLPQRCGWLSREYIRGSLGKLDRAAVTNRKVQKTLSAFVACRDFAKKVVASLPKSIIHSDVHGNNVLFCDNQLAAFIDWEDAIIAPALFDFVSTAAYWCFDGVNKIRPRLYKAFRESYEKVRPLTELENRYLSDCMRYVGVVQTMWRLINSMRTDYDLLWGLKLSKVTERSLFCYVIEILSNAKTKILKSQFLRIYPI